MGRHYLITGVAGFIGSHLLARLLATGNRVTGLDNFLTGTQANLDAVLALDPGYGALFRMIRGDVRSLEDCTAAMSGVDAVFHEAAIGSVPWSLADPLLTHQTNVTGFLHICEAARACGVRRVVYASSSAVYGDSAVVPNVEAVLGHALSPYASSKRCDELFAESFARCFGLELVGLRYFNVFGPRQDPNGAYAAVIPKWLQAMQGNVPCAIYGNGASTRDFCYVDNVVDANCLAAGAALQELAPVFNVAAGKQTTLLALHSMMAKAVGEYFQIAVPAPGFEAPRAGDIVHSCADITKARRELGYEPACGVEEGIVRYVAEQARQ